MANSKNKDTSKLNLVSKTVVRRGKPITMRVYEDPNKSAAGENSSSSKSEDTPDEQAQQQIEDGIYTGGDALWKPSEYAKSLGVPPNNWFCEHKYVKPSDYFFFVVGGQIDAIAGISKDKDNIVVRYVATQSKDEYYFYLYKTLCNAMYYAYHNELGFSYVATTDQERTMLAVLRDFYGIRKRGDRFYATNKDLIDIFGEIVWPY